ncbi:MAG: hypothetical protein SNJ53_04065 [Thermodesulfovibrionales bacterium]
MIRDKSGLVLVIVLWIITILMSIAISLSYLTKIELLSTFTHSRETEFRYYALAGIEKAKVEISYQTLKQGQQDDTVWRFDGTPYTFEIGDGMVEIRILDESGKIDINHANEEVLKRLLVNQGVDDDRATEIVDAIMDWKDPDDIPRPKGAESEYYQSLQRPYKAKNAPFESVDELINVKGITKEILYGTSKKNGIHQYLTVYTKINRVSIYHSPLEVLMAVTGIDQETATLFMNRRKDFTINNASQLIQEVFGDKWGEIGKHAAVYDSGFLTIISDGFSKGTQKQRYRIITVVSKMGMQQYNTLYYKEPSRIPEVVTNH